MQRNQVVNNPLFWPPSQNRIAIEDPVQLQRERRPDRVIGKTPYNAVGEELSWIFRKLVIWRVG
jgi:hypothetical protein